MSTAATRAVAKTSDVAPGTVKIVMAGETRIALCNVDGEFFAIEDICSHDDGPLGEGKLQDCRIECPRHGALFDVKTGAAVRMPAIAPVKTYPVTVKDGEVFIEA